jgi:hypothetical protein
MNEFKVTVSYTLNSKKVSKRKNRLQHLCFSNRFLRLAVGGQWHAVGFPQRSTSSHNLSFTRPDPQLVHEEWRFLYMTAESMVDLTNPLRCGRDSNPRPSA